MSPSEMLEKAYLTKDWGLVIKSYKLLFGTELQVPIKTTPDESTYIANPRPTFNQDDGERKYTKRVPIKISGTNMFEDRGDKGDVKLKPDVKRPVKRVSKFFIKMTCSRCGGEFSVNRAALPQSVDGNSRESNRNSDYVCDKCVAQRRV